MLKKMLSLPLAALLLAGCAGNGLNTASGVTGIGGSLVQMYVQNQCVTELQKRKEWRLLALAMSAEKQAEWEDRICGCVSQEAPNHLSAADLAQLVSEQGRSKVMADVTVKTVNACFKRIYQGKQ